MQYNPTGPLAGVKVLDLSAMISGPFAAAMLADQGADVIKVEPVNVGDIVRHMGSTRNGHGSMFHNANRGKRSIALDLKSPDALDIIYKLAAASDVALQNFRLGVAERLKIDYQTLNQYNDNIIYLSINGFGQNGPLAKKPAFDNILQAFAGVAYSQASDDEETNPDLIRQLLADKLTAMNAAQSISAALFARENGHGGQHIQLSMMDTLTHFLWMDLARTSAFVEQDGVAPGLNLGKQTRLFKFKNGFAAISPVTDEQFKAMFKVLGIELDEGMSSMAKRNSNPDELEKLMQKAYAAIATLDIDEGVASFDAVGIPATKARNIKDLPSHPQSQANGSFQTTDHPIAGKIIEPVNPPRFSGTPSQLSRPSPALGEHTDEILEELGYTTDYIQAMRDKKIVA